MIKVAILGSTGSIGTQALKVIEEHQSDFFLEGITAHSNKSLFAKQIKKFQPKYTGIIEKIENSNTEAIYGRDYIEEFINKTDADIYLNAIGGIYGLEASVSVLEKGRDLALANKESIVSFGKLLMKLAKENNATIYPVDSEHSALWQSMNGEELETIERLIITASGGPFRTYTRQQLEKVTPIEALKHPTWTMGRKISIDSATLMNKGLEVIEAAILFNMPYEKISVLVHPQSIVHSLVEFNDGALIAQLGTANMGQAIQYALYRGKRVFSKRERLDLAKIQTLEFHHPDVDLFSCLALAYEVGESGGIMPAVMNTANNIAVERFLKEEIKFLEIPIFIQKIMNKFDYKPVNSIDDILEIQKDVIEMSKLIAL